MVEPHHDLVRVLIVDDDPRIRTILCDYLKKNGCFIRTAESGKAMRDCLANETIDVILLDLNLSGEDGLVFLRDLRERLDVAVILITGRNTVVDKVIGLEFGADDYITKPFSLREVLARVRSVLRRQRPHQAKETPEQRDEVCNFDGWRLNLDRRELTSPSGQHVQLTTSEFALLREFVKNAGRVLDRDRLMDLTRGRGWQAYDRTIDALVSRLRKKIETDPKRPTLIKSVHGVGYVFASTIHRSRASGEEGRGLHLSLPDLPKSYLDPH